MRLLVLSDTHGHRDQVTKILRHEMAASRPDYLVFLGDGLREIDEIAYYGEFSWLPVLSVRGNCDFFGASDTPELREWSVGGYRLLLMHGHRYEVKSGLSRAASFAVSKGADAVLYGHTHAAREDRFAVGDSVSGISLSRPLVLFNPGSAGYGGEYGIVTLGPQGITCERKVL